MAYTDASTDNYTSAAYTEAYTDAYTLTHSTPTGGHSHGGGLPPAFHSGETAGQPNPAQLGASAQEHTGTGRSSSHHAGHHGDPGSDLGPEEIERNNHVGCQAKAVPSSPTIGPSQWADHSPANSPPARHVLQSSRREDTLAQILEVKTGEQHT